MERFTVIALEEEEMYELCIEIDVDIDLDMGIVSIFDKDGYDATDLFIEEVAKRHNINIPCYAKVICSDGDQDLDFYAGIIFRSEGD